MTEGHNIIMRPEIPIMSWVLSEEHSNKKDSAQKNSIIQWQWFIKEYASRGIQGGTHQIPEQVLFSF